MTAADQPRHRAHRTPYVSKPVVVLTVAALVGSALGTTLALWSANDHAFTFLRSGMAAFDVNDADHDRDLIPGTGGFFGTLKSNPADVTEFKLPVEDLIAALDEGGEAATAVGIDAIVDGDLQVAYTIDGVNDGNDGSTSFADNVNVTVIRILPGAACTTDAAGTTVYEGLLADFVISDPQTLVNSESTVLQEADVLEDHDIVRNWRAGSDVLCFQFTSPDPVRYQNTATGIGSVGDIQISAQDTWSGDFDVNLRDGKDTVLRFAPVYTPSTEMGNAHVNTRTNAPVNDRTDRAREGF